MFGLSTWCRDASLGPEEMCARAATMGASGLGLDGSCEPDWAEALCAELARRRETLPALCVEAPFPRVRAGRPPFLASTDREERSAALHATRSTIDTAAKLGARVVIVRLGRLDVRHDWQGTVRAFSRGSLSRDRVARIREDRMHLLPRALDAARFGLDAALDAAASAGVTLAIANGARWFEVPDAIELGVLAEDFRGAPIAAWHDAAAAHAAQAVGFGAHVDLLEATKARIAGAWLTDAAGLRGGLPWGRGEVDRAAVLAALGETALHVVHAAPGATEEELQAAILG
jgi:sugar phosphate isomerase/epimerase